MKLTLQTLEGCG